MEIPHIPVLLDEVLDSFKGLEDGYFVDCTLGYAGHSSHMLKSYPNIKHIGIDRDDEALEFSKKRLEEFDSRSTLYKGSFSSVFPSLTEKPIVAVLADFGVSSLQLDKESRGFSFNSDILDMRMDQDSTLTAYEIVNNYSQDKLEYILDAYGEVKQYKKLASAIISQRSSKTIESAKELSQIAIDTLGTYGKIHPATLMFQAIRIEVNDELAEIEALLDALESKHNKGEIVALISFHSLEDRLVKNRFKKWSKKCICDADAMRCTCGKNHEIGKAISSKPIIAKKDELKVNSRSRSAKLRVFRFSKDVK